MDEIKAKKLQHQVKSYDCHTLGEAVILLVTGEIRIDDASPVKFAESFILVKCSGNYLIQSDVFALNYG